MILICRVPKYDFGRCSGERCSRPLPRWFSSGHRGGLHRLRGQIRGARAAVRARSRRVLAVRLLPLRAYVVQGHLLRPALFLQEFPRGRAMLRVRVPGPAGRGHEVPRAPASTSSHPRRQLLSGPAHALHPAQDHFPHSRRGHHVHIDTAPAPATPHPRRRTKPLFYFETLLPHFT